MNKPRIQYHALNSIKSSLAIVIFFLMFCSGCDEPEVQIIIPPKPPPPISPLDSNVALYLSLDSYYGPGLIILNANSFKVLDTLFTYPGVPWTIEFSPDNSTWYSCWGSRGDASLYTGDIHPLTVKNRIYLDFPNPFVTLNKNGNNLIVFGNKGIVMYDRTTLQSLHKDTSTIFYGNAGIRTSKMSNKLYYLFVENKEIQGVAIYDLDSLKTVDTLKLFDNSIYYGLEDADIIISPDDQYLFLSAWNWRGGGGFGSFIVINLFEKRIISEFLVGSFSQLAMSPDGKNVYISDPGGYLYNFPLTGKVWRYNVQQNTMEVFLKSLYGTDKIAVADDNRTVFIATWVNFYVNGKWDNIVKVDGLTGQIISTYALPLDSSGHLSSLIRNIELEKYLFNNIKRR